MRAKSLADMIYSRCKYCKMNIESCEFSFHCLSPNSSEEDFGRISFSEPCSYSDSITCKYQDRKTVAEPEIIDENLRESDNLPVMDALMPLSSRDMNKIRSGAVK